MNMSGMRGYKAAMQLSKQSVPVRSELGGWWPPPDSAALELMQIQQLVGKACVEFANHVA